MTHLGKQLARPRRLHNMEHSSQRLINLSDLRDRSCSPVDVLGKVCERSCNMFPASCSLSLPTKNMGCDGLCFFPQNALALSKSHVNTNLCNVKVTLQPVFALQVPCSTNTCGIASSANFFAPSTCCCMRSTMVTCSQCQSLRSLRKRTQKTKRRGKERLPDCIYCNPLTNNHTYSSWKMLEIMPRDPRVRSCKKNKLYI